MLILMDEHYWKRLWTLFEIAAFYRRAGLRRMEIVPLHVPILKMGIITGIFIGMYTLLVFSYFPFMGQLMKTRVGMVIWGLIIACPSNFGVIWAASAGRSSNEAVKLLQNFRLEDAECFSNDDREAILGLIADWFTDRMSGETDPERLRLLGWHRFETMVRNELAMHVRRAGGGSFEIIQACIFALSVGWLPWYYDQLASPDANLYMIGQQVISSGAYIFLGTPLYAALITLVVSIIGHFERCGRVMTFLIGAFLLGFLDICRTWI